MVKSHLTSAVKEEIVALKNQIKQLKETCTRLEQENTILKQYATPETLKLLENRVQQQPQSNNPGSNLPTQQVIQTNLNTQSATNLATTQTTNPVTFELGFPNNPDATSSSSSSVVTTTTTQISEMMPSNNSTTAAHNHDHMTTSFTEQAINNNGYIINADQISTADSTIPTKEN